MHSVTVWYIVQHVVGENDALVTTKSKVLARSVDRDSILSLDLIDLTRRKHKRL